ncbi:MAG: thiamine pyrophosphate-binding protein [Reyranellales bacterium]
MTPMPGGDAIVDSLLRYGIDTVFGLPGVQMYGLFDAFARNANRLKMINARHEQTTAYTALGYLRHRQGLSALRVPSTQTAIGEKGQVP